MKGMSGISSVKSYTGSDSTYINKGVRDLVSRFMDNNSRSLYTDFLKKNSDVSNMFKVFEKIEPIQDSFWVFRSFSVVKEKLKDFKIGEDYIHPNFVSTSLRPIFSGNVKMRIFLPIGSRVIPILSSSKHDTEDEIILPACSILKPIEIVEKFDYLYVTCIYTGTVYRDLFKQIKQFYNINEGILQEMKKQDEYDPNEKFGGKSYPILSKQIQQMIKQGKLKTEKPKSE